MTPTLTLFFIVEPPTYQYMACYLAASIRNHLPANVKLVGYCPSDRIGQITPEVIETLRRMDCPVRPFERADHFSPVYPHGNKILACLEERDTDFSGFVDSDVLILRDNKIENLIAEGHVSASPAASLRWAPPDMWERIYGAFDLPVPEQRIRLMRDKRVPNVPYFSSGFVLFPQQRKTADGKTFPQIWYETAKHIDAIPDLDHKRPYLDQMSLPVAIHRAGLEWKELPEEQHYILGGSIRGTALPEDRPIYTVHYRKWDVLKEIGLHKQGYDGLRRQVGTSRVGWIFKIKQNTARQDEPAPQLEQTLIADVPAAASAVKPVPAPPKTSHDPSKALLAVVTMVKGDHAFLARWLDYYGPQVGRQNLYVLRHGHDPQIDRLAQGANIIHVPDLDDKSGFDRRRWQALSQFTSGLSLYYNWVLCSDVDEIVAPDPALGRDLAGYLGDLLDRGGAPMAISPFAVEIVHTPASERDPLTDGTKVLSVRRNFRLNSNYAKPCLTRGRVAFSIGGHGSTREDVALDTNLFLFHLRYMDDTLSRDRLAARKAWIQEKDGETPGGSTWHQGADTFDRLSAMDPVAETCDFPEFVQRMVEGRTRAATGNWFFRSMRSKVLYRLPDRFAGLF